MRLIFLFLMLPMLVACTEVLFQQPQPPGGKNLKNFPAGYLGTYMDMEDSSIYILMSTHILEEYSEDISLHADSITEDSDVALSGDTLIDLEGGLRFPVERRNDSVFASITLYDTVFNLEEDDILRKHKKTWFLNIRQDTAWAVYRLDHSMKDHIILSIIDTEEELPIIESIIPVDVILDKKGDTLNYLLNPTLKEFKELLRQNVFSSHTDYVRFEKAD